MADYNNPYQCTKAENGRWLKSNFHVHCEPGKNGLKFPLKLVLEGYKTAGYDIIMHSMQRDWADHQRISEEVGIKMINGNEYVAQDGILLIGTKRFLSGAPQEVIDSCVEEGGFCIVCHPNQGSAPDLPPVLPKETSAQLKGLIGIEIYNGCIPRRNIPGSGLATDFWDEMLSSGKALWGFANDDFHDIYEMNVGWTMIYAASDAFEDVKTAVKRGSLYASNGLRLYDFSFDGNILKVTADYPFYRTRRIAYKFIGKGGKLLKEEFGSEGTYCPKGNEEYIRVQATGEDGSMLWCQPLLNSFFFK